MYAPLNNNCKLICNQVRSDCEMRIICGITIVTSTYVYACGCPFYIVNYSRAIESNRFARKFKKDL